MAASIPMLRVLVRRVPAPKPAQFIELPEKKHHKKSSSNPHNAKQSAEEPWSKVSHMEAAHLPGYSEPGRSGEDMC